MRKKYKLRRVYWEGTLLTQVYHKGRWLTMPQGGKGPKIKTPAPDEELTELNRKWLRMAIAEAERGPTELERALEELTALGIEEQKRFLQEGPKIPDAFKQAIRGSFDVARTDASTQIQDQFNQFIQQSRRDLISRGLAGEGSSVPTDIAGFAAQEQGKALSDIMSRLSAAQASAEVSGATDLAEMTLGALNLSSGRLSEQAGRKLGLLGGGMGQASSFFENNANRRLQAALANAGSSGGGWMGGIAGGMGGALGGMGAGAAIGAAGGPIGALGGGIIGGLGGLFGGFR